ncbi:hypothetical protein K440DRAFT_642046 [Wilcoxina mikolae CBS 423.85]|nr:hypothetical protein K440DRAFT_642046 [Wilcoxina mikolae CBS 423.85]
MTTSSLDLRTLTYLTHVDDNLCCPICRSPLIDPETTKCRHTFCADCISGALEISSTCPVDRNPLGPGDVSAAPIMIANLVNDLAVLCPNRGLGCTATLPRSLDHEEICPQLSSSCPHCLLEFPRPDIRSHQLTCEEGMVVCKALSVGCPWSGRRREASEHAISCAFTYLRPLLHEHASRIAALELENKLLRKKIDVVIPSWINSERSYTDNGLLDGQTIQILTEQEHIRSDLERLFAAMADMDIKQSMLTMHMSDNMRTRDDIAMIGAAVSNLRSQLHGLQLLTLRQQSGTGSPTTGTSTAPSLAAVGDSSPGNDRVKL